MYQSEKLLRKLKRDIIEKKEITVRALDLGIQRKRKKETVGSRVALLIIGREEGFDISRYGASDTDLSLVRGLDKSGVISRGITEVNKKREIRVEKIKEIGPKETLLQEQVYKEAVETANVYSYIYLFENSVRNLIGKVLSKKYGSNWFEKTVSEDLRKEVDSRKKQEDMFDWHSKRGQDPLSYLNFGVLEKLIKDNWSEFKPIFGREDYLTSKTGAVGLSRLVVSHSNPLKKADISRVKNIWEDWVGILNSNKEKI